MILDRQNMSSPNLVDFGEVTRGLLIASKLYPVDDGVKSRESPSTQAVSPSCRLCDAFVATLIVLSRPRLGAHSSQTLHLRRSSLRSAISMISLALCPRLTSSEPRRGSCPSPLFLLFRLVNSLYSLYLALSLCDALSAMSLIGSHIHLF